MMTKLLISFFLAIFAQEAFSACNVDQCGQKTGIRCCGQKDQCVTMTQDCHYCSTFERCGTPAYPFPQSASAVVKVAPPIPTNAPPHPTPNTVSPYPSSIPGGSEHSHSDHEHDGNEEHRPHIAKEDKNHPRPSDHEHSKSGPNHDGHDGEPSATCSNKECDCCIYGECVSKHQCDKLFGEDDKHRRRGLMGIYIGGMLFGCCLCGCCGAILFAVIACIRKRRRLRNFGQTMANVSYEFFNDDGENPNNNSVHSAARGESVVPNQGAWQLAADGVVAVSPQPAQSPASVNMNNSRDLGVPVPTIHNNANRTPLP